MSPTATTLAPSVRSSSLSESDYQHCCVERGLNPEWVKASCKSINISEATSYLGYPAKSGGILIEGANGQYQFRPHKPWSNKPGQKAPKYRTALGDEYDALLPAHPTDKFYWNNLSALKERCYSINGTPMLLVTEGGFKAIALSSYRHPAIALLGVEMGQTSSKDDPQGKRYLVPELERFAKLGFGFIFGFDALLQKVNTFPKARRQLKAWLKANVLDNGETIFPNEGTPQGGVISPLLANIALHGMELRIKEYAATWKGNKRDNKMSLALIRYADDFVIIHKDLNVVKNCQRIIGEWLSEMGLELNKDKTQIIHTLKEYNGKKPGFDFLSFNVRQYPVGKCHTGKKSNGKALGFKTIIKPSKEACQKHYEKLAKIIDNHNAASQHLLIGKLNPIIIGWTNYYKAVSSKETFSKMYYLLHQKLRRWADRRHPNKGKKWVSEKYWHKVGKNNWVFKYRNKEKEEEYTLIKHPEIPIEYHTKVKGEDSPYNGDTKHWATRMGKHPEMKSSVARLLKKQKGKCNYCNLTFQPEDLIETDHIIPKKAGGHRYKDNLQLLHKHCHDVKTKDDLKLIKRYKSTKSYQKTQKWFNQLNWGWIDDIPTLA